MTRSSGVAAAAVNAGSDLLKLEKVFGVSALSNAAVTTGPSGVDTYYAAGSVVVCYNAEENRQTAFYKATKAVSCLTASADGRYLAVGERGHQPLVLIWDVTTGEKIATLPGSSHKHGVSCLAFSRDARYLVTAGFRHDRQLIVWDWEALKKVSVQKIGNKVNCVQFHPSGAYFVTCGDRHLKWWYLTYSDREPGLIVDVVGKPASILENHKNAVFMDIKISAGHIVYCATSTGLLCTFNETRYMDKWVQLESPSSYALVLLEAPAPPPPQSQHGQHAGGQASQGTQSLVLVGCAEGLIRAFSARSLHYIATLPLPVPAVGYADRYPAVLALTASAAAPAATRSPPAGVRNSPLNAAAAAKAGAASGFHALTAIYADHSIFVWNVADVHAATQARQFSFHRACVWDAHFITAPPDADPADGLFPPGTFVTCSADNTVRLWCSDPKTQRLRSAASAAHGRGGAAAKGKVAGVPANPPGPLGDRELLHVIEVVPPGAPGSEPSNAAVLRQSNASTASTVTSSMTTVADMAAGLSARPLMDPYKGIPDTELPDRPQTAASPRSIAVHPSGRQMVCGDRTGLLRVYDLAAMAEIHTTQAHAAEVLTLAYSPPMRAAADGAWTVDCVDDADGARPKEPLVLLASAGRDRLVHVFDASSEYTPVTTLDNHSSSVTIVKFTPDGKRLLSCGGDRTMVFNAVNGPDVTRMKSVQTPHGTINGLAVEATNKFAVTSGQDRRLNIWNLQSGKHMRAYKNDAVSGELYKSDVDPSGMFVAACAFDKTINVFDFFSGELIAQVGGHSELITSVRFSPDGRYLLSVGGDGCVMMWSLADPLVIAMQDRLLELLTSAQKRQLKVSRSLSTAGWTDARTSQQSMASAAAARAPGAAAAVAAALAAPGSASKWATRVDHQSGYELLGRRVVPAAAADRNKFTLELTATVASAVVNDSALETDDASRISTIAGADPREESHAVDAAAVAAMDAEPDFSFKEEAEGEERVLGNRLANTLEASDEVMLSVASDDEVDDDEDDGAHLFKPAAGAAGGGPAADPAAAGDAGDEEYEPDFESEGGGPHGSASPARAPGTGKGGAAFLTAASSKIEKLEQSALDLETWLESMIRSEGALDEQAKLLPPAPANTEEDAATSTSAAASDAAAAAAAAPAQKEESAILSESLSSAFFKNLRLSGEARRPADVPGRSEVIDTPDDDANALPPPPPPRAAAAAAGALRGSVDVSASAINASALTNASMEVKRRETAAAVAQMKDRLRSMGILDAAADKNGGRKAALSRGGSVRSSAAGMVPVAEEKGSAPRVDEKAFSVAPPPPPPREAKEVKEEKATGEAKGSERDDIDDAKDAKAAAIAKAAAAAVASPAKGAKGSEEEESEDYGSIEPSITFDYRAPKTPFSAPRHADRGDADGSMLSTPGADLQDRDVVGRYVEVLDEEDDAVNQSAASAEDAAVGAGLPEESSDYGSVQPSITFDHMPGAPGGGPDAVAALATAAEEDEAEDVGGPLFGPNSSVVVVADVEAREDASAAGVGTHGDHAEATGEEKEVTQPVTDNDDAAAVAAAAEDAAQAPAAPGAAASPVGHGHGHGLEHVADAGRGPDESRLSAQAELLRIKAEQFKGLIQELTRVRQTALQSFDELAQLRSSLEESLLSEQTHGSHASFSASVLLAESEAMSQYHQSQSQSHAHAHSLSAAFSGKEGGHGPAQSFSPSPPRTAGARTATADVLFGARGSSELVGASQASMTSLLALAEADALLSEFKGSFLLPTQEAPEPSAFASSSFTSARLPPAVAPAYSNGSLSTRSGSGSGSGGDSSGKAAADATIGSQNTTRRTTDFAAPDLNEELALSSFLERYSDRLVDIVAEKMAAKAAVAATEVTTK